MGVSMDFFFFLNKLFKNRILIMLVLRAQTVFSIFFGLSGFY